MSISAPSYEDVLAEFVRRGMTDADVRTYGSKRSAELVLKELTQFNWHNREVLLMFDSDSETNPGVSSALSDCALKLSGLGARPIMLCIPPAEGGAKQGADDFIMAHG